MTTSNDHSSFRVERLEPTKFKWRDYLDLGEACARGFQKDGLFNYAVGPVYQFGDDHAAVRSIKDPRDRLKELIARTHRYQTLVNGWARLMRHKAMTKGYDFHLLYDDSRVVGMAGWVFPDYMTPKLEQDLGRVGLVWHIKKLFIEGWMKLTELWELGFSEHPVQSSRLTSYITGQNEYLHRSKPTGPSQLAGLGREELEKVDYPTNSMVYLSYFVIDSDYQKKGLGSLLMRGSLDIIPHLEPEFCSPATNSKSIGPQKFFLEASPSGKFLYSKFGFETTDEYEEVIDGEPIVSSYMVMTRSCYGCSSSDCQPNAAV